MWKPDLLYRPDAKVAAWSAFWFATFLCLLMLGGSLLPFVTSNPAFPAFFSFLPVVFLMIAQWQRRSEKVVADLQKRVESLEAEIAAQKVSTS